MSRSFGPSACAVAALLVLTGYCMGGLCCLLSMFTAGETIAVGMLYLLVLFLAKRAGIASRKPLLSFMAFVLIGSLTAQVAWTVFKGPIYSSFPVVVTGSVAWSLSVWMRITYSLNTSTLKRESPTARSGILRSHVLGVLTIPIVLAVVAGVAYAMTNSATTAERVEDVFTVAAVGLGAGAFLALPLACVSFPRRKAR